jgi:hypothetical protein
MELKGRQYFDTTLPHPAFEPGAAITLTATGAEVSSFTLYGQGVDPLHVPSDGWLVSRGEPLVIAWTPGPTQNATMVATFNVDQHGTSPGSIYCEMEDTGTLEIPASMIDTLLDMGISGFATGSLERRTVDSVNLTTGCVELIVRSSQVIEVNVASHTPCNGPTDCPTGMQCDLAINTCI